MLQKSKVRSGIQKRENPESRAAHLFPGLCDELADVVQEVALNVNLLLLRGALHDKDSIHLC
jgi:hypothetical protein